MPKNLFINLFIDFENDVEVLKEEIFGDNDCFLPIERTLQQLLQLRILPFQRHAKFAVYPYSRFSRAPGRVDLGLHAARWPQAREMDAVPYYKMP